MGTPCPPSVVRGAAMVGRGCPPYSLGFQPILRTAARRQVVAFRTPLPSPVAQRATAVAAMQRAQPRSRATAGLTGQERNAVHANGHGQRLRE